MQPVTTPLIAPTELEALLRSPAPPVLFDVRWSLGEGSQRGEYLRGHLPGAQFVDLEQDLADPAGDRGRHPLPGPGRFAATMRGLGMADDSLVVCYDAGPATAAARAWWLLRHSGHQRAQVLDGGYAAWVRAGLPVRTGEPQPARAGSFTVRDSLAPALAVDQVLDFAARHTLLDARDTDRYLGEREPVDPVAGHIPGAHSAPSNTNVDAEGRFLAGPELSARFEALGVPATGEVAVYCGSGISATHEILALEVAGRTAALYPGSWSEWITDPDRPVATSEAG